MRLQQHNNNNHNHNTSPYQSQRHTRSNHRHYNTNNRDNIHRIMPSSFTWPINTHGSSVLEQMRSICSGSDDNIVEFNVGLFQHLTSPLDESKQKLHQWTQLFIEQKNSYLAQGLFAKCNDFSVINRFLKKALLCDLFPLAWLSVLVESIPKNFLLSIDISEFTPTINNNISPVASAGYDIASFYASDNIPSSSINIRTETIQHDGKSFAVIMTSQKIKENNQYGLSSAALAIPTLPHHNTINNNNNSNSSNTNNPVHHQRHHNTTNHQQANNNNQQHHNRNNLNSSPTSFPSFLPNYNTTMLIQPPSPPISHNTINNGINFDINLYNHSNKNNHSSNTNNPVHPQRHHNTTNHQQVNNNINNHNSNNPNTVHHQSQQHHHSIKNNNLNNSNTTQSPLSNRLAGIMEETKPYECNSCHKKFKIKMNLTRHIRIHTGEMPFECTDCYKKFRQKSQLTTHIRTHTGERPFLCTDCHKKFRQKAHLITHIRTHTGEEPFECTYCNKKFKAQGNLTAHIRAKHQRGVNSI